MNIPNHDSIANLAPSANVEVPAWFDASGMSRESIGSIPEPIAGTLRPWIDQLELLTDAIIQRDRDLALLALLADRTVVDVDVGLAMGRELMDAHAANLREYH